MLGKERVALAIVWLEFGGREKSPGEADSGDTERQISELDCREVRYILW
jgi:hypothetical protein